jgi:ribulose-5-phosphate 4-epimerase/fuculose-1-phosphate aldolase
MAHHGMVVFGRDCDHALALAVELETSVRAVLARAAAGCAAAARRRRNAARAGEVRDYGQQD